MPQSKAQIARRLVELGSTKSFNTLRGYNADTLQAMLAAAEQLESEMQDALTELQREQAETLLYEAAQETVVLTPADVAGFCAASKAMDASEMERIYANEPELRPEPQSASDAILVRPMGFLEAEKKRAEPLPVATFAPSRRPATWGELVAAPFLFVFGLLRL